MDIFSFQNNPLIKELFDFGLSQLISEHANNFHSEGREGGIALIC